ncbi:S9 family peptidase [soil metagenome]
MKLTTGVLLIASAVVWQAAPAPAAAQIAPSAAEIAADYARAERFLGRNADSLVFGATVQPSWLADDRFWYRNSVPGGHEFILVNPARGTRERAFDHERMARVLSEQAGQTYSPLRLPLTNLQQLEDGRGLGFELDRRRWVCDVVEYRCPRPATPSESARNEVLSPDGRRAAFRRDHDLWVREVESGREIRLTTDGVHRYGYATDNEGWRQSERPVLLWSPDSRRIATYRLDERGVGDMHLLETTVGRPRLHSWAYAIPGDTIVPMLERIIIDVDAQRVIPLRAERDHQRTSSCCGMLRGDVLGDAEWSGDGNRFVFASVSRDYRDVRLRIADPATGEVRTILEERGEPFFEATTAGRGIPNWRVLHQRNEILWFSQRDGWGHLYLYDLTTGRQKRQITSGRWNVSDVLHLDEPGGWVYFTGTGRERGRDPYYRHYYRIRLNGSGLSLLTPEDADHVITVSPTGAWFVGSHSRVDVPPVTLLRRADGRVVRTLEEADISRLASAGMPMPIPFTAQARDGATQIHGVMYRPSNFDEARRYPIINNIYPGPQVGSVGPRSFSVARRGDAQALAELGFIVVQIDALGTPMRSMAIHAHYYGDLQDNGLEDQMTAMRQLAQRYPWIDLDRVGIYGHSGGGYATAAAMLRHPEFFHVGVAGAGNHDNRGYTSYWGEKWHGKLVQNPDGTDTYTNQANQLLADRLQGKLMISYGTMDNNVHPDMTLLLVDELIRHNKDFDLVVMPNRNHGYSRDPYWTRRTWDYFVRHLSGMEPPREYDLRPTRR